MHKRWVYELNGKLNPIGMKIGMHVKKYRTCNSTVGFSKYEFNSKLLSGVTLLRVTLSVCVYQTQYWLCIWMCLSIIWVISNVIL